MGHALRSVELAGRFFEAHVFVDLQRRIDEANTLLRKLSLVDQRLKERSFETEEEAAAFIDSAASGMSKLYSIRKTAQQLRIARDEGAISKHALKFNLPEQSRGRPHRTAGGLLPPRRRREVLRHPQE